MPHMLQCCYMPGDTFGISAALAVDDNLRLVFLVDRKIGDDKTDTILKFYQECGLEGRIDRVDISPLQCRAKAVWNEYVKLYENGSAAPKVDWNTAYAANANATARQELDTRKAISKLFFGLNAVPPQWPYPVWHATERVAQAFEKNLDGAMQKVAKCWKIARITTDMEQAIASYMTSMGLVKLRKNVVVLWSRQSGKRGGAHVEMDSSYEGIRQLAALFGGTFSVLLAGDEKDGKLAEIAARLPHVFDVSVMWDHALWQPFKAQNVSRLAQLAFFKHLAAGHKVVHVGMRSGNLEAMAMLGMPTFFLEPAGSPSGDRMLAFAQAGIPYSRMPVSRPPGLTGRWGDQFSKQGGSAATKNTWEDSLEKQAVALLKDPTFCKTYLWADAPYQGKQGAVKSRAERDKSWDIAMEAARVTLKGLPLSVPSDSLPAVDPEGHVHYRGFRIDDVQKLAQAVMKQVYKG